MQNSRIPPVNPPPLSQTNAGDQDNRSQLSDDEYFKNMPPGYRFRPTDDELIVEYLMKKVNNEGLPRNRIYMVKLYDFNPENLVERYKGSGENEWYFFTPREKKYRGGSRPKRAAGDGYWKATGADKTIVHNGEEVGYRKSLLYHKGRPPGGDRTCWLMNEYRLKNPPPPVQTSENSMRLDDWVLCRIHRKPGASNNNNRNQEAIDNTDEVVEEEIQNSTVAALEHEAEVPNVGTYSQPLNMVSSTRYFSPGESSSSAGIPGVPYIPLNHHQAGIPRVPSIRFSHPINHQAGIPRVPSIRFSHPINHQAGIPGIPSIPAYQQAGTSSNYYYNFPASIDMVPTMYPDSLSDAIPGVHDIPFNHQAGIPGGHSIPFDHQAGMNSVYIDNFPAPVYMDPSMHPEPQNHILGNRFTCGACPHYPMNHTPMLIPGSQHEQIHGTLWAERNLIHAFDYYCAAIMNEIPGNSPDSDQ
ncbi:hypothetical protein Pfo_029562 [Paulownia fortunei]|nr:hypothetical protein Pfo_029562 [Paulownia fortunei]